MSRLHCIMQPLAKDALPKQYINSSYRNSGRIIVDDEALADEILERLRPYLKEIERLEKSPLHKQFSDDGSLSHDPPAQMSRFNERLRFLKYVPGTYVRSIHIYCHRIHYYFFKRPILQKTLRWGIPHTRQERDIVLHPPTLPQRFSKRYSRRRY